MQLVPHVPRRRSAKNQRRGVPASDSWKGAATHWDRKERRRFSKKNMRPWYSHRRGGENCKERKTKCKVVRARGAGNIGNAFTLKGQMR